MKALTYVKVGVLLVVTFSLNGCKKDDDKTKSDEIIIETANYYVSPSGDDDNPGTEDKPLKTWQKAIDVAVAGNLIYLRGGTYYTDTTRQDAVSIKKSGLSDQMIRLWAYPNEKPILQCGGRNLTGIRMEGNYWHFKGFEITGVKQTEGKISRGFIAVNSNSNIYEMLNIHHNGGPGFAINNNSDNNLVLNCDFHNNYDPFDDGGNADGMSIAFIPKNVTNKIKGCRFWNNSDDGVDLWKNEGTVYIDSCWAWHNGYIPGTETAAGNGQGIKFGRTDLESDPTPQRIVTNCKSFFNRVNGYDQNSGNIIIEMRNNVAYKNLKYGFFMYKDLPLKHILDGNTAIENYSQTDIKGQSSINAEAVQTNNSWQNNITSASIFESVDATGIDGPRNPDGSLPDKRFLKKGSK